MYLQKYVAVQSNEKRQPRRIRLPFVSKPSAHEQGQIWMTCSAQLLDQNKIASMFPDTSNTLVNSSSLGW
jgi:hypothetical protein